MYAFTQYNDRRGIQSQKQNNFSSTGSSKADTLLSVAALTIWLSHTALA